jgi:hypothetical protein
MSSDIPSDYRTIVLESRDQRMEIATQWEQLRQRHPRPHIEHHRNWPDILQLADTSGRASVFAVALYRGDELAGVASFVVKPWHWRCRLGYRTVIRFPMVLADLCGDTLLAPDELEAQEALLLASLLSPRDYHSIFLECLPTDSPLWGAIHNSRDLRRRFWVYHPSGISQRRTIRISGTFQDYLKKFSSHARGKLRRGVQKLEQACGHKIRVASVTRRDQVPWFLRHVESISTKSWQGERLGAVIQASKAELERFGALADHGWLRCYLLSNDEQPIAFVVGWQDVGVYYYEQIGYDPAWKHVAPGTVLLYRVVEDLFADNPPQCLDFRYGDSDYKRIFGNYSFGEANIYLVRKGFYTGLVLAIDKTLRVTARLIRTVLDWCQLREVVRHFLRARSSPVASPDSSAPSKPPSC